MYPALESLKKILLAESYISKEDSAAAEKVSKTGDEYVQFLTSHGVLTPTLLGQAIAEAYKLPFADLPAHPAPKETTAMIPEPTARAMRIVVAKQDEHSVQIATDTPEKIDPQAIKKLFTGRKISLAYTLPEFVSASFASYVQPLDTRFSKIVEANNRVAPEIVDEIIKDALHYQASDIHFEPSPTGALVRFRVDGTLREAGQIPREYYDNVLNRIKVESGMRIDEHLAAQDGAMQRHGDDFSADLRVSLVPTVEGEKVVMRVLGSYVQSFTLADIGLNTAHRELVNKAIAKPFGMILTVGPTGSGKTTTLYSLLKLLNKPDVNITTIEDPVEYKMKSINQIQVRENGNITFAKGLRAIVRQDPDIILVGEIRDQETAEISVNAALTGHLLLSTFHANDAATAMPRLIDMGIEPFLLSSTLDVIIAQRLVRKICANCRYSLPAEEAMADLTFGTAAVKKYFKSTDNVYAGKGCAVCNGSGYKGRTALYEIIEVTSEMQELMLHSPATQEIEKLARSQGSLPMFDDGMQKVKDGTTTIQEVLRVVDLPKGK